jgi:hypothetical protein
MCRSALLFVVLMPLWSMGQSRPEQQTPTQNKSNEAKPNPTASPVNPKPTTPTQQNQSEKKTPKCPLPAWTDPFWSNWALVLITGIAVWAALRTLDDLKTQTRLSKIAADAAKKSADAAFVNAQAVINAERAWIIGVPAEETEGVHLFGHPAHVPKCEIGIKNSGRTPGKIVTICLRFEKMTNVVVLAPEPYFGVDSIMGLGGQIVVSGDTPLWITLAIEGGKPLSAQERIFVRDKMLHLVCWGEINYEDVLTKEPHMTRFCCLYTYGQPHSKNGFQTAFDAPASYRTTT